MVKQFTQDEINKISGVYKKKYGGDENAFRADIEKQYGTGAFDTVKSAMKGVYEAYKSEQSKTKASDITSKITTGNAQSVLDRANKLKAEGKIGDASYLTIKNKAQQTRNNAGASTTQTTDGGIVTPPSNGPIQEVTTTSTTGTSTQGDILPPKGETPYTPGSEPTSSVTSVNTADIKTSEDAAQSVTDATKANIDATSQAATDYQAAMNVRTEEDKKLAEEQKARIEAEAAKKEATYREADAKISLEQKELERLVSERKLRDVEDLKEQQKVAVDEAKAKEALAKWENEQAIKKAEKEVEVGKIRARLAYNKLGLGFSSYAVNTIDRIATEGATEIAGLKLKATANNAKFAKDVSDLEFSYTKTINDTIDVYTDKAITLKENSIKRIKELELNILATDKEKNDAIKDITKEYLDNKRENEDKAYEEMKLLRDDKLKLVKELQAQMASNENTFKTKISSFITSGTWNSLSPIQQQDYLSKANMTQAEVQTAMKSAIYNSAYKLIQGTLGGDFLPSVAQMDGIQNEVNRLMLAGRPMEEAITIATNRFIKSSPEYIQAINSKNSKSSSGTRIKTSDMKQDDNGNWYAWTGNEWVSTGLKGKTSGGATPIIEKDAEGNLISINRDTNEATPIVQKTGTENKEFLMSTKEGVKGAGSFYQVPTYSQVKGYSKAGTETSDEELIKAFLNR